ncbi:hypothetical protein NQ315_008077 [Exocentrus adspersus]|uniref:Protein kinase domain-containing protein n=1 Tax=Exocentrus adspersus TaxID=1586481 RepID=A0AAV8VWZ0_9CUCU|nr:hypothetical protein NQ315_008077 [Exocentrus adspersus]
MKSTTEDFSEIRKSIIGDETCNRGSCSSVKRQPRKLWNLRPLNLDGIKKEIEQEKISISMSIETPQKYGDQDKAVAIGDNGSQQNTENILKDITNTLEPIYENPLCEHNDNVQKPKAISCHRSSVSVNNTRLEIVPQVQKPKNDSFDLDFSALSLSTPVKQDGPINNENVAVQSEPVQKFVTPKINNKQLLGCNLSTKQILKTPINGLSNASAKNILMPCTSVTQKIRPFVPENQLVLRSTDKWGNTFSKSLNHLAITPSQKPFQNRIGHKSEDHPCCGPIHPLRDDTFNRIVVNKTEYIMFNLLGKGGSSEVYLCYNPENKLHVAIKCVSLHNSASANDFINEVKLLHQLQTCNKIIKMYDYEILESEKKLLVVLENGGKDLSTILKQLASQKSHIPLYMLLFYWMEMLHAVKQIHSQGIIHSDLKPANFLKVDEGLKLIDFGIASSVQSDMTSVLKTKQEGSCNYISPEALITDSSTNFGNSNLNTDKYKIHFKSDVWSLGCILYQLVYKRTPFQHISQLWLKLAAIMNPEHKIDYPDVEWVSPKVIGTIKKCLQYNVKLRPSVDELIDEYDAILHNI